MIRLVHDLLINAAESCPDNAAVLHKEAQMTYGQVYHQSVRLAHFLLHTGLNKGDRVCFYLEKRFEKVVAIFGINLSGGVFVPIRRLARPEQAVHIINDCRARILITTSSRVDQLRSYFDLTPALTTIITVNQEPAAPIGGCIAMISWDKIRREPARGALKVRVTEQDPAAILYTSGSTGRPKGVVLSHLNIVAGAEKVSEYLKISRDDRLLGILTFGFDYGLNQLTSAFLNKAQIVLLDHLFPADILRAVEKYEISGLAAVAATWIQLLQKSWENSTMHKLRYVTNTGGFIPPEYVARLRQRLPDTEIFLMYGLTEAFRSTYLDPSLVETYPTSIGQAIPGEEILVLDENDRPVNAGGVGELVHRGVLVSRGYWGDPEMTALRFKKNPLQDDNIPIAETVVYSGDYVRIDENGLLYFVGRKDEMIKCAGNRISPTEIEEILYRKPEVTDAVAFGLPDEIYGQSVFAVVSLNSSMDTGVQELKKYCSESMPPYMVPRDIEIRDALPRNTNGKLDRSAIKKEIYAKRGIKN